MSIFDDLFAQQAPPEEEDPFAAAAGNFMQGTPEAPPPQNFGMAEAANLLMQPPASPPVKPRAYVPDYAPPVIPTAPPIVPQVPTGKGGVPTRQDVLAENAAGVAKEAGGIQGQADVQTAKAEYLAKQRFDALEAETKSAEILDQAREDIKRQSTERIAKVNDEIQKKSAENQDPNKFWHDQSTLGNILTLIGIGLGGYMQSKTGGRNLFLEQINQAVERTAAEAGRKHQRELEALKEKRGSAKEQGAADLDAFEFKVAHQVEANNRVMKMIDAAASRYDSDEVQQRAQQMIGGLQQKNAALLEGIRGKAVSEAQQDAQTRIAGGHLQLAREEFAESKKRYEIDKLLEIDKANAAGDTAKAAKLAQEKEVEIFAIKDPTTGKPIQAPDKLVRKEINAKIGLADGVVNEIDNIVALQKEIGLAGKITSQQQRRIDSAIIALQNSVSLAEGQGVVNASDAARSKTRFGNPTGLLGHIDELKQLRGTIIDKVNSTVRSETDNPNATWKSDADPEYSVTVRPPGFKPRGTSPLDEVPVTARIGGLSGRRMTKEEFQQHRADNSKTLAGAGAPPVNPYAGWTQKDYEESLQPSEDPFAKLAGGLF